jgi:hypothetical protein
MMISAVYDLPCERNSFPLAPSITVILVPSGHSRGACPRESGERESTAADASRLQPRAIYRIAYNPAKSVPERARFRTPTRQVLTHILHHYSMLGVLTYLGSGTSV